MWLCVHKPPNCFLFTKLRERSKRFSRYIVEGLLQQSISKGSDVAEELTILPDSFFKDPERYRTM
jgi:hypothetical protein